jgi:hypothetical protein
MPLKDPEASRSQPATSLHFTQQRRLTAACSWSSWTRRSRNCLLHARLQRGASSSLYAWSQGEWSRGRTFGLAAAIPIGERAATETHPARRGGDMLTWARENGNERSVIFSSGLVQHIGDILLYVEQLCSQTFQPKHQ